MRKKRLGGTRFARMGACALSLGILALVELGCVRAPQVATIEPLFFPPPPLKARIQYLGSISSSKDLPSQQSSFADFVLGPEPTRYPLAKPIAAALSGSHLYVCDTVLNTVIVYDMDTGEARPLTGDRGNGKLQQANNIAIDDAGKIYVADKIRQAVLVYDSDEKYLTAFGRPGEVEPVDVAIGKDRLYVCDIKNHRIEIWSRSRGVLIKSFGEPGNSPGQFYLPTQVALGPEGNLFITDTGNFRVEKFSPEGEFLQSFGGLGKTHGKFLWPKGLAVDRHGRIYVADSRFANVQIFDKEGRLLLFFGGPGPGRGNLDLPAGVTICPWPSIPWLDERLAEGFDPEELIIVISQKGAGFVNFFAVARDPEGSP